MKNKIILISFTVILIIVSILVIIFIRGNRIIAEDTYINWAWGFTYIGTVICENGNVYKFEIDDYKKGSEYKSLDSLKKISDFILDNKTEYLGKLDRESINKIKEYSKNYKTDNKDYSENAIRDKNDKLITLVNDAGESSVKIWNYKTGEKITLTGFIEVNSIQDVYEIIEIIEKNSEQ